MIQKQSCIGPNKEGLTVDCIPSWGCLPLHWIGLMFNRLLFGQREDCFSNVAPPHLHFTSSPCPLLCNWCLPHSWGWVGRPGDKTQCWLFQLLLWFGFIPSDVTGQNPFMKWGNVNTRDRSRWCDCFEEEKAFHDVATVSPLLFTWFYSETGFFFFFFFTAGPQPWLPRV